MSACASVFDTVCTFSRVHGPSVVIVIVGGPPPVTALLAAAAAPPDAITLTWLRRLRWSIPAAFAAAAICSGAVTYWIEMDGFESGVEFRMAEPLGVNGWPR